MDELAKEKIRKFLKEFKEIASKGRGIDVIPRRENIDNLAQLGLTKKNRNEEIMTLSLVDYCKGPEPDKDKSETNNSKDEVKTTGSESDS